MNHLRAISLIPNVLLRIEVSMEWSMVSHVADKSSTVRDKTDWFQIPRRCHGLIIRGKFHRNNSHGMLTGNQGVSCKFHSEC